jgi:hypothetical protein
MVFKNKLVVFAWRMNKKESQIKDWHLKSIIYQENSMTKLIKTFCINKKFNNYKE